MTLRSPASLLLFSVSLIAAAGNMALQAVLPLIGRAFALPDTLVSAAFAISALLWTLSSPSWARPSDRLGRKRVILVGLGGFVASMTAFGVAATSGLEGWLGAGVAFILMAVARAIYGLFGSAAPIASQAYVADRTSRAARTRALSALASAQGLGTVLGPALAPVFILPFVGLAGPLYAFAALGAIVLVLVWRLLPSGGVERQPSTGQAHKGLWKDLRLRDFLLYGLLLTGAQAVNIGVIGFHVIDELAAEGLGLDAAQPFIGLALFAGAAMTLMVQWGLIPLLRLEPRAMMRWGAGLALVGNGVSALATDFHSVVVGYALLSMGMGFARPGFTAGASLATRPDEQGTVAGLIMALSGLSFLAPPVIGVALYEWSAPAPFGLNLVLIGAALALCVLSTPLKGGGDPGRAPAQPASTPGPEGATVGPPSPGRKAV
ncbi:MAG: MFS transporter [Brevundimonas sp.]